MLFQCPKLTPLQSRFAASFAALLLLGIVYWSLSNPHFAYAAELEVDGSGQSRGGEDHNWHRIEQERLEDDGLEDDGLEDDGMGEDEGVQSTVVVERAVTPSAIAANNAANTLNIQAGNTTLWRYSKELLMSSYVTKGVGLPSDPGVKRVIEQHHAELRKRQDSSGTRQIYVSINTCLQPTWNGTGVQTTAPPQLVLYVSTEAENTNLGPNGQSQIVTPLDEGFANVTVNATGDWYMSVHAPALTDGFVGVWNYELAVSIDDYYHAANLTNSFLYLIDTDIDSALLVTDNLTLANASTAVYNDWMGLSPPPFVIFAANKNHTSTMGISNSYCGWSNARQIAANQDDVEGYNSGVQMEMITRGIANKPKEQFYVTYLNRSSTYSGVLAMVGNSTASGSGVVGGGGKVWQPVFWTTKTDGNCALLYNLSFCDEVAYAVPSNPQKYNITGLRAFYDNNTIKAYEGFNYSLQQVPCNTTTSAQYSLAKNCTDCAAAYKTWLCAVSIPRCEDFSNTASYLQPRNMGQVNYLTNTHLPESLLTANYTPMPRAPTIGDSPAYKQTYNFSMATNRSRNPAIDTTVFPGPYNEVLPCEDLCWSLIQSCPSSLGFACPQIGRGLERGYGNRKGNVNNTLTCNYLGAYFSISRGEKVVPKWFEALLIAVVVALAVGVA